MGSLALSRQRGFQRLAAKVLTAEEAHEVDPLKIKGSYIYCWSILKILLQTESEGKCAQCGKKPRKRLEVHHIDGCALNNERSNLELLCLNCHKKAPYKKPITVVNPLILTGGVSQ